MNPVAAVRASQTAGERTSGGRRRRESGRWAASGSLIRRKRGAPKTHASTLQEDLDVWLARRVERLSVQAMNAPQQIHDLNEGRQSSVGIGKSGGNSVVEDRGAEQRSLCRDLRTQSVFAARHEGEGGEGNARFRTRPRDYMEGFAQSWCRTKRTWRQEDERVRSILEASELNSLPSRRYCSPAIENKG